MPEKMAGEPQGPEKGVMKEPEQATSPRLLPLMRIERSSILNRNIASFLEMPPVKINPGFLKRVWQPDTRAFNDWYQAPYRFID